MQHRDQAAQPLRWWAEGQIENMRMAMEACWREWACDWLAADVLPSARVDCELAWTVDDAAGLLWQPLGWGDRTRAWVSPAADPQSFSRALGLLVPATGDRVGGQLHAAVQGRALDTWCDVLCSRLALDKPLEGARQSPDELLQPWSGAVIVRFVVAAREGLRVLVDGNLARQLAGPPGGASAQSVPCAELVPLQDAVDGWRVRLSVRLREGDVDLGSLASLSLGDVVPFPHELDEPLLVSLSGAPVLRAHLGRSGGNRAAELTSHSPASRANASTTP